MVSLELKGYDETTKNWKHPKVWYAFLYVVIHNLNYVLCMMF